MFLERNSSTSKISLQKITIFLVVSPHYSAICATGFGVVREAVTFGPKKQLRNQYHKKPRSGEVIPRKNGDFFLQNSDLDFDLFWGRNFTETITIFLVLAPHYGAFCGTVFLDRTFLAHPTK